MHNKINSQPHEPNQEALDYQRALEVMEAARLSVLGEMAVAAAEDQAYQAGFEQPALAVVEATAVAKQAVAEQAISRGAEEYLAGGVAAEAETYLKRHNEKEQHSQNLLKIANEEGMSAAIESARKSSDFLQARKDYTPPGHSNLLD